MGNEERIAAIAGRLSKLKARHNDITEEIEGLETELAELKRTPAARPAAAARRPRPGYADEDEEDDELEDDEPEAEGDEEPGEEQPAADA